MENLNSKLILNNINYLIKKSNKRIGELETEIGVSLGYFSKLLKEDKVSIPSTEIIYNTSRVLKVPLEELLTVDLSALDETEQRILNFIDKLINNTKNRKSEWSENHPSSLSPYSELPPIFEVENDMYEGDSVKYRSSFFNSEEKGFANIVGDYYISIYNDSLIYFTMIQLPYNINQSYLGFELYLLKDNRLMPICCELDCYNSILYKKMERLYSEIRKALKYPFMDKGVIDIIDDFIKNN